MIVFTDKLAAAKFCASTISAQVHLYRHLDQLELDSIADGLASLFELVEFDHAKLSTFCRKYLFRTEDEKE